MYVVIMYNQMTDNNCKLSMWCLIHYYSTNDFNIRVVSIICSVIGSSVIWESGVGRAPGLVSVIVVAVVVVVVVVVVVIYVTVPVGGVTVMDIVVSAITAPVLKCIHITL